MSRGMLKILSQILSILISGYRCMAAWPGGAVRPWGDSSSESRLARAGSPWFPSALVRRIKGRWPFQAVKLHYAGGESPSSGSVPWFIMNSRAAPGCEGSRRVGARKEEGQTAHGSAMGR
jgi:hypothetical protein